MLTGRGGGGDLKQYSVGDPLPSPCTPYAHLSIPPFFSVPPFNISSLTAGINTDREGNMNNALTFFAISARIACSYCLN